MRNVMTFLLYLLISQVSSSQSNFKFIRYTTKQGLVNNDAKCMCQDSLGFIWVGTNRGLSRFDGVSFKNFKYNKYNSNSIGNGWANKIIVGKDNNLWLAFTGSHRTFLKYDLLNEKFIDYTPVLKVEIGFSTGKFNLWNIFADSFGRIWLSIGVRYFNPLTGKVTTLSDQLTPTGWVEDQNHNIWVATGSNGIHVYNSHNEKIKEFKHVKNKPKSISCNSCKSIFLDSDNNIWIGTVHGLNRFVPNNASKKQFEGDFIRYFHDKEKKNSLSDNLINDISETSDKKLIIATVNGLCVLNKKTNAIHQYYYDQINHESINSNLVRSLFYDKHNNVWITTNQGIGKLQERKFKGYSHSRYKNSISHNKVQYLYETNERDIWIATPVGIDIFNRKTDKFKLLTGTSNAIDGLNRAPVVLCSDSNNRMWIGTWGGGIRCYDYKTKTFRTDIKYSFLSTSNIVNLFIDSKEWLYLYSQQLGLFVYDLKKDERIDIGINKNKAATPLRLKDIEVIFEDSNSNIWIGTNYGLYYICDIKNFAPVLYLEDKEITYLLEDDKKDLWIGTTEGLYHMNKATKEIDVFDVRFGSKGNLHIFSMLEDEKHNLWISSNEGFFRFTMNKGNAEVIRFRQEEGIVAGEFLPRSCAKLYDGAMVFGGTNGFILFRPEEIVKDTIIPPVILTNLKISNNTVIPGQKVNGQVILDQSFIFTKSLKLNYKNNAFTIGFTSILYNMAQHNRYAYKLVGYDKNNEKWQYTNAANRQVEYMNLPQGEYTFKVKAANSYGIWNDKSTDLKIAILPPWWKTTWFTALWVVALIFTFFMILKIRTKTLQRQKLKLEQVVKSRTQQLQEINIILQEGKEELEQQASQMANMNKDLLKTNSELKIKTREVEDMAKQLHEADQSKLRFFANVSHEFKTPLSLIIAPLEKISSLKQPIFWEKTNISRYHELMLKNANRLIRLINQIIDFRKIEQGGKKLNLSKTNIVEFIEEVITVFSTLAEQKYISISLQSKFPVIAFAFDQDVMEKILYNLISNAIKYTPEGGEVNIQLRVKIEELRVGNENLKNVNSQLFTHHSSLIIDITDTGIGIKPENLNKIFDRFYTVETHGCASLPDGQSKGTGIGLAYTKELVEFHKGEIKVESDPQKGTVFTIVFPINEQNNNIEKSINNVAKVKLKYIPSMLEANSVATINNDIVDIEQPITNIQGDKKHKILIVEDNTELREFIKGELISEFDVLVAENGKEGLEVIMHSEPDLILSDIMMPVLDGIELCKTIKTEESTSHIPIILLTAKEGKDTVIKGLETGADDYITKPFNMKILKIKIKNIFLTRKRLQEKFNKSLDIIPIEITHSKFDKEFLQKAIELANQNMNDQEFNNDTFVKLLGHSRSLVYKKIKNLTGQSVSEFIRTIRLKAAARLFLEGNTNIAEVSYMVGYKYQSHFSSHFSNMFGKSPKQYIKENSKK